MNKINKSINSKVFNHHSNTDVNSVYVDENNDVIIIGDLTIQGQLILQDDANKVSKSDP